MKRFITLIAVLVMTALGNNVFAQKNSTDDYNLRKAYEVVCNFLNSITCAL